MYSQLSCVRPAYQGSKRIVSLELVARAKRRRVRNDGWIRPPSILATTGCIVPIFRANSSRASNALLYFGSFSHRSCISLMRVISFRPYHLSHYRSGSLG